MGPVSPMPSISPSTSSELAALPEPAVRTTALRVLGMRDVAEMTALLDRDPVAHVFIAGRLRAAGLDPWRLGGEIWGHVIDGRLASACYSGSNLVPVECSAEALSAFAERARRQGRRCSSIVGPAGEVRELWRLLEGDWGPAREIRRSQPLLATGCAPLVQAGRSGERRICFVRRIFRHRTTASGRQRRASLGQAVHKIRRICGA